MPKKYNRGFENDSSMAAATLIMSANSPSERISIKPVKKGVSLPKPGRIKG